LGSLINILKETLQDVRAGFPWGSIYALVFAFIVILRTCKLVSVQPDCPRTSTQPTGISERNHDFVKKKSMWIHDRLRCMETFDVFITWPASKIRKGRGRRER
jgi:hypothetical protein